MNIKQLNGIVAQKDTKKILQDFMLAGFKDMTKEKTLKEFSLLNIAKSEVFESTEYHDGVKFGYIASLHDKISGLDGCQVIWLQVYKIDYKKGIARPNKSYIYYYKKNWGVKNEIIVIRDLYLFDNRIDA